MSSLTFAFCIICSKLHRFWADTKSPYGISTCKILYCANTFFQLRLPTYLPTYRQEQQEQLPPEASTLHVMRFLSYKFTQQSWQTIIRPSSLWFASILLPSLLHSSHLPILFTSSVMLYSYHFHEHIIFDTFAATAASSSFFIPFFSDSIERNKINR